MPTEPTDEGGGGGGGASEVSELEEEEEDTDSTSGDMAALRLVGRSQANKTWASKATRTQVANNARGDAAKENIFD